MTRCHAWKAQVFPTNDLCHTSCKENMWLTKNGEKGGSHRDRSHDPACGIGTGFRGAPEAGCRARERPHPARDGVLRGCSRTLLGFLLCIPASRGGQKYKKWSGCRPLLQGMVNKGHEAQNNPFPLWACVPAGESYAAVVKLCQSCRALTRGRRNHTTFTTQRECGFSEVSGIPARHHNAHLHSCSWNSTEEIHTPIWPRRTQQRSSAGRKTRNNKITWVVPPPVIPLGKWLWGGEWICWIACTECSRAVGAKPRVIHIMGAWGNVHSRSVFVIFSLHSFPHEMQSDCNSGTFRNRGFARGQWLNILRDTQF